ncbi:hypothetical protein HX13_03350 [Chryseobacterium sp. P1-3]|uniref:phospholipase effector Tle1 domain-containing protein n=1 Tax=Chryseobacterium sp. (strain P1-3) TaxID=1517683 RepID=UPI0004E6DB63|nr:DUF2235 domain-containing protein [Chryseobacterium sp. P1-3]KFF75292.1 hypothetical protein HX13_03350 [Chryseobacterium sp. P1-3]
MNKNSDGNSVISVGIFFDDTGNNGMNVLSPDKLLDNNESYYGAFTNIYKLYSLFIGDERLYIEGIGTVTGSEDNNFAMATCANPPYGNGYSSDDKLQKAENFVQEIFSRGHGEYHFYLYGFGRGGMLVRTFCNRLLAHYSTEYIKIRFLGVFDTVESKPFNTYDLSLSQKVERSLHLCAVNESRFFFPLTGFFENSKAMLDQQYRSGDVVWKEIFVPGAHADVGGGYLDGPQSVFISTDFINAEDVRNYISDIRNAKTDAGGIRIWDALLSGYRIKKGDTYSQAYITRDKVYHDLSKVYGKLMLEETNDTSVVFSTDTGLYFEQGSGKHAFLSHFYTELRNYAKYLLPEMKPVYDYEKFTNYIHISSNFGLYSEALLKKSHQEINAELINNGLNVSSSTVLNKDNQTRLSVELHLPEDSFVADFLYGTNVPNNDIWIRSIVKSTVTQKVIQ